MPLLFVGHSMTLNAQDVIVLKSGKTILSNVIEVGSKEVIYKKYGKKSSPKYRKSISEIKCINYADGERDEFVDEEPVVTNNSSKQTNKDKKHSSVSNKTIQENTKLIEGYNNMIDFIEYMPVYSYDIDNRKKAPRLYHLFGIDPTTAIMDDNIQIHIYPIPSLSFNNKSSYAYAHEGKNQRIGVSIINKTDRVIYLDFGSSFIYRNAKAHVCYTPTSTTNSKGSQSGISLGLGPVADVLGIGGIAGTLANGIGISGGTNNSKSTTVYSQRFIAIAPHSTQPFEEVSLYSEDFNANGYEYTDMGTLALHYNYKKGGYINKGSISKFSKEVSPLSILLHIQYGFSENIEEQRSVRCGLYIKKIIGLASKSEENEIEKLVPQAKNMVFFITDNR